MNKENKYLDLLCDLFGNHYGNGFNILGTKINSNNIFTIINLVDAGELSPLEIHRFLNN
jgi:hypothetical protein